MTDTTTYRDEIEQTRRRLQEQFPDTEWTVELDGETVTITWTLPDKA